jgi:hypothetical protein
LVIIHITVPVEVTGEILVAGTDKVHGKVTEPTMLKLRLMLRHRLT